MASMSPRFPSIRITGWNDFCKIIVDQKATFDDRYLHEQSFATQDPYILLNGTCAPCLRSTTFVSRVSTGEATNTGRIPNWREELRCDCADKLNNRQRAMLHFIQSEHAAEPWMDVLILGDGGLTAGRLSDMTRNAFVAKSIQKSPVTKKLCLDPDPGITAFHLIASFEVLHRYQSLPQTLNFLWERILPGGKLIFTVPFHTHRETTASAHAGNLASDAGNVPRHEIGWNILQLLENARFSDAATYIYWSQELGYLGTFNTIFRAVK